ncbi:MAG: aminotransferase class V-fold PLP-dependent enzyme [Helicobacter sp.]|nr:aminotransferase class V-fold PLP-dependent enzyme [Helicobacter sp.]
MTLLNPGPANTTLSVKLAQVVEDICPREREFGEVMESITNGLLEFIQGGENPKAVLLSGSGTLAVECAISSALKETHKLAIIVNGAYGQRMEEIASVHGLNFVSFKSDFLQPLDINSIREFLLRERPDFIALIHSETTSGLLNDISSISRIAKEIGAKVIADCMSSYACYEISLDEVDFIIASSNKNIQGMPGVSFVIANEANILEAGNAKSLYLNLKAEYEYFKSTLQMRFTPPVQTLYALNQAIIELKNEGLKRRFERYKANNTLLREGLENLGFEIYPKDSFGVIITAIALPDSIDFHCLHAHCKKYGYTIYPGKIAGLHMFRIANIGAITPNDIAGFLRVLKDFIS